MQVAQCSYSSWALSLWIFVSNLSFTSFDDFLPQTVIMTNVIVVSFDASMSHYKLDAKVLICNITHTFFPIIDADREQNLNAHHHDNANRDVVGRPQCVPCPSSYRTSIFLCNVEIINERIWLWVSHADNDVSTATSHYWHKCRTILSYEMTTSSFSSMHYDAFETFQVNFHGFIVLWRCRLYCTFSATLWCWSSPSLVGGT